MPCEDRQVDRQEVTGAPGGLNQSMHLRQGQNPQRWFSPLRGWDPGRHVLGKHVPLGGLPPDLAQDTVMVENRLCRETPFEHSRMVALDLSDAQLGRADLPKALFQRRTIPLYPSAVRGRTDGAT